jgi:hypothetical protein
LKRITVVGKNVNENDFERYRPNWGITATSTRILAELHEKAPDGWAERRGLSFWKIFAEGHVVRRVGVGYIIFGFN